MDGQTDILTANAVLNYIARQMNGHSAMLSGLPERTSTTE